MKNDSKLTGKEYWRSLDQLADTPEFRELVEREFPESASEMNNPLSRRRFLSLMGASIAFAGLASCRKPVEKILPYVKAPETIVPGIPQYYATTMPLGTSAYGLIVESHEGRPTKIEGNEKHPSSLGKSNAWIQASVLGLFDPDRSQSVLHDGQESDWNSFVADWREKQAALLESRGKGLAVLSESFRSPSAARLADQFMKTFPEASWYTYEPVSDSNIYEGLELVSGKAYQPVYHYDKAAVVLAIDSDFLLTESENISASLGFSSGRKVTDASSPMNRLYVVENNFSVTGGMADHRLRLQARLIPVFTIALAQEMQRQGMDLELPIDQVACNATLFSKKWITETVKDLLANRGKCLIVAGRKQPAQVHALVYAMNKALGNVGTGVTYRDLQDTRLPSVKQMVQLAADMNSGKVKSLIILGGNPVFNAPADLNFKNALKGVGYTVHLSSYVDETSRRVNWHLPASHFLESWADARSADGTASVVQPLIAPLFDSRNMLEVVQLLISGVETSAYELVRETWQKILPAKNYERDWRRVLHDGLLENSDLPQVQPRLGRVDMSVFKGQIDPASLQNMEIVFQPSPALFDGRFANNGWLQEMPDPVTKLTWDNAVLISPNTAAELGLANSDLVTLDFAGRNLVMPVWIQPGHADYSVSLNLGYGHKGLGRIANGSGFNTFALRVSQAMDFGAGLRITATGKTFKLASTQDHGSMEGRPLVREADLSEYREHPEFAKEMVEHPPLQSLWDERPYDKGYQWGMTIDLNSCTGCNACVIACQSENNVPIVGKEQVLNGREMHWIRLDRYYAGELSDPELVYQPVACQHCENAPCEQVCPVAATVHDKEGLNVMAYNRCIGTRYCSNNCPYKVRRFNFFNYTKDYPEIIKMVQNPDVTVRSRGVMEKCTFCTQRINYSKIQARNEGREVADGEIQTACQQSCPADAIVFGNINDPNSAVSKMKKLNRDYTMLGELNLKTRTTYLAKLRNPNPALVGAGQDV